MDNIDDVNVAYGKLKSNVIGLITLRDVDWLCHRLGATLSSWEYAVIRNSPEGWLTSLEARGFLMNDEEGIKKSEELLREINVPAAELVKTYQEQYAGKLKGVHPASFGELKVRLRQLLTTRHVYELGTLFELDPRKLDEIQSHASPALRLLNELCSKNIIDENNLSRLLNACKTINHYAAAAIVVRYLKLRGQHEEDEMPEMFGKQEKHN